MNETRKLTWGQITVLTCAFIPMIGFGALGAWGTYTNIASAFDRSATALGVVAAGEGSTLVLALVLVGLTLLNQSYPAAARLGLWAMPAVAAVTGVVVAGSGSESVVYAMTPMAMCVSAEGLGFLARRIVVYRTGVDAEAQRRNAEIMRQLAYHTSRKQGHPDEDARKASELKAWELAARVGKDDVELGAHLVQVQRERMGAGADAALAGMFGLSAPQTPAIEAPTAPAPPAALVESEPVPVTLDRVPDPAPAVPEPVPAGVRLLPIVALPKAAPELPAAPDVPASNPTPSTPEYTPAPVPAAVPGSPVDDWLAAVRREVAGHRSVGCEQPRTRVEVRAEYVPEDAPPAESDPEDGPEPHDDSPPPPGEDSLTPQARQDFPDGVPSIRDIKERFHIGQRRAQRIQNELKKVLT